MPEGKSLAGWKAHTDSVEGLQFINHDRELISAGFDGVLARWTHTGKLIAKHTAAAAITSMVVNESEGLILTGHTDGHVRTWRVSDLTPVLDLPVHRNRVRSVAWHFASGQLALSGSDGRVYILA